MRTVVRSRGTGIVVVGLLALSGCKKSLSETITADTASAMPTASATTSSSAQPNDVEVTFHRKRLPCVGNKITDNATSTFDIDLTKGSRHISVHNREHKERTVEALEIDGDVYTKLKITYSKFEQEGVVNGKAEKPPALAGKTFTTRHRNPHRGDAEGAERRCRTRDGRRDGPDIRYRRRDRQWQGVDRLLRRPLTRVRLARLVAHARRACFHRAMSKESERIINEHILWSLGAGLVPVPLLDIAAVSAIQLDMLKQLCTHYGVKYSESEGKVFLSALTGTIAAKIAANALKLIPGIGSVIGGISMSILSGASTYALGQVAVGHFENKGTFANLDLDKAKRIVRRASSRRAKRSRRASRSTRARAATSSRSSKRRKASETRASSATTTSKRSSAASSTR